MSDSDTDGSHVREAVLHALAREGRLRVPPSQLTGADSLYDAGLTSHATVSLMLDLEDELDVELPEELVTRETFRTIDSIVAALAAATGPAA